jgi:hypothetical protein
MKVEVSNGELVDKVSILWIKLRKIKDENKLANIKREYQELYATMRILGMDEESPNFKKLIEVNSDLWEIEDKIRRKESAKEFDEEFIELARSVYFKNDVRFEIKSLINNSTNSDLREEKEYVKYKE